MNTILDETFELTPVSLYRRVCRFFVQMPEPLKLELKKKSLDSAENLEYVDFTVKHDEESIRITATKVNHDTGEAWPNIEIGHILLDHLYGDTYRIKMTHRVTAIIWKSDGTLGIETNPRKIIGLMNTGADIQIFDSENILYELFLELGGAIYRHFGTRNQIEEWISSLENIDTIERRISQKLHPQGAGQTKDTIEATINAYSNKEEWKKLVAELNYLCQRPCTKNHQQAILILPSKFAALFPADQRDFYQAQITAAIISYYREETGLPQQPARGNAAEPNRQWKEEDRAEAKKKYDEVCGLIEKKGLTVVVACDRVGISKASFYNWKKVFG